MITPQPPENEKMGKEIQPDFPQTQKKEPADALVGSNVGDVHGQVEGAMEDTEQEPPFSELVTYVAMRLDYGEIFENEAVVELALLLNTKKLPMTGKLLRAVGVKKFTLTHEDFQRVPVIDFLTKKQQEWMSIEDENIPGDFGLPFDVEEDFGDEMRGVLVHHEQKGFFLRAPDHKLYPLDATALAPLQTRGGAPAFINKEIVVQVDVSDGLRMKVQ